MTDWSFDAWPAVQPQWHDSVDLHEYDRLEFHVDLGCGRVKKGRIGIDRYPAPGVNVVMDLERGIRYSDAKRPGEDASALHWPIPHHWGRGIVATRAMPRGYGLPFEDDSIESIISHHALEHVGEGFMPLVDDIYRVLKPGGIFRAITPLFPSTSAVSDADHCRYFMEDTWEAFCGTPGDTPQNCWLASFSVPYTRARFEMVDKYMTPSVAICDQWTSKDARELRAALKAMK